MTKQAFVLVAPVLPVEESLLMLKLSLLNFVENLTDDQIREGIVTWPEGEGDVFLLPALVPETKVLKGPWPPVHNGELLDPADKEGLIG